MVKDKIFNMVKRRYLLTTGIKVKLLIKYFAAPKGEDDIRIVYNPSANKLNDCVWVPTSWLPTIDLLVRAPDKNLWMTDCNIGDMFLNFQLHKTVILFTNVNLSTLYDSQEDVGPRWAVWEQNLMGFAASPYNSIKMAIIAEEICREDRCKEGRCADGRELNPFQWKRIQLNLPGMERYDPCSS
jgi:hypothetical protein